MLVSWISPKTVKAESSPIHGLGFFAVEDVKKGEVLTIKGGHIIDKHTLEANKHIIRDCELQITDYHYIAPLTEDEFRGSMVYCNHSCEPNLGMAGNVVWVAMRDIKAGEEITCDYSMYFSNPNYTMECNCQTPSCRHHISGNDWQIQSLQQKYAGYYSWYVQQKINNTLAAA